MLLFMTNLFAQADVNVFQEIARFDVPEARQGIAVDEHFFYAIDNSRIGKYRKDNGERLAAWQGEKDGPIIHLDSGMIFNGKLYCAHSNYPGIPMTSSIEVWDAESLQHIDSHSFGIYRGSCTWVDRHDGFWWAAFAHYEKWKAETFKGTEWTSVVKFDDQWQELASWVFPAPVVERFRPMSNSGGSWGPDGLLYCTGHDRAELYALQLPAMGSELIWKKTVPIPVLGQGIAWDRFHPGEVWGIRKKDRQVVGLKLAQIH